MRKNEKSRRKGNKTDSVDTQTYLAAVSRAWSGLQVGSVEFPLSDLYKPLHVKFIKPTSLDLPSEKNTERDQVRAQPLLSITELLAQLNKIVLLGAPGSGKSTTLQYLGYCFSTPNLAESKLGQKKEKIPVLLSLKLYEEFLSVPGTFLESALAMEVSQRIRIPSESAMSLLTSWRDSETLMVLLDGLDEVSESKRESVRKEIQSFSAHHPRVFMLLSSRTAGYSPIGSAFNTYVLQPLQDEDEVIQYLQTWLRVFQTSQDEAGSDPASSAEQLHQRIKSQSSVSRILNSPLILRLAAEEYATTGEVAGSRLALYEKWVENAWRRTLKRGASEDQKHIVHQQLEEIAWCAQNQLEAPVYDASLIHEKNGLVSRVGHQFVFLHQTLQEYFVSRRLLRIRKENPPGFWNFIRPRLHIPDWREALLLLIPQLPADEAEGFIIQVSKSHSPFERSLLRDTSLGILLAGELRSYTGTTLSFLLQALKYLSSGRFTVNERRVLISVLREHGHLVFEEIKALLFSRDPEIAGFSSSVLAYMKDQRGLEVLLANRHHSKPRVRLAVAHGFSWYNETREYLKPMIYDSDQKVREKAFPSTLLPLDVLNDLSREGALEAIKQSDVNQKRYGIRSLGRIHNPADLNVLADLVMKDKLTSVYEDLANALGHFDKLNDYALLALLVIMLDEHFMASMYARESLPTEEYPRVIDLLLKLEKVPENRRNALLLLGKFGSTLALDILTKALSDNVPQIRTAAASALGDIKYKDDSIIELLLNSLHDQDSDVRASVASTLGDLSIYEARDQLIDLMDHDPNERVRFCCALALGRIYSASDHRNDEIQDKRSLNTWDEKYLDTQPVVYALAKALDDNSHEVRQRAAMALAKLKLPEAAEPLMNAIYVRNIRTQVEIIEALGEIEDPRSIECFLVMLDHKSRDVRLAAAKALVGVPTPQAVRKLLYVLIKDGHAHFGFAKRDITNSIIECQKSVAFSQRQTTENRKQLRSIIWTARIFNLQELLEFGTVELEFLDLQYSDPLMYRPSPSRVRVIMRIAIWIILTGIIATLATIGSLTVNWVSDAPLLETIQTLVWSHPLRTVAILLLAAMVGVVLQFLQTKLEED